MEQMKKIKKNTEREGERYRESNHGEKNYMLEKYFLYCRRNVNAMN